MIELCLLAHRLSLQSSHDVHAVPFTILPLFLKLSPTDMKAEENVEKWRKEWERLQSQDSRISAAKCEEAVTKLLPRLNGVVRRPESDQGEASFIEDVVHRIFSILYPRKLVSIRYGIHPHKQYVGVERLCQVILDEFQALEDSRSTYDNERNSMDPCIVGMYGVPGSGKSTICNFLLETMFEDFRGKVILLELPRDLKGADDPRVKEQYVKLLSMLYPYRNDFASMHLDVLYGLLLGARCSYKMFLVLDNILPSNYESYQTMAQVILCSPILGSGSRVMLVAQTSAVLENLLMEVKHKYVITEVPCLTEEEAAKLIRYRYPSVKEDVLSCLLRKCSFQSSSFMYVPFVFEQMGVLLREKRCNDVNKLEVLWEMVDECKRAAIQKLVEINIEQLPKDLRVLFLDITLFIIPARYSKLCDAIPILCRMHGIKETFKLEWMIMDLQKHCALLFTGEELKVHDIFTEYARNVPENTTSYVDELVLETREQHDQRRPRTIYSKRFHRKFLGARTICINIGTHRESQHHQSDARKGSNNVEVVISDHQEIRLDVEVGVIAQALFVRNSCRWCKCVLGLSGGLSSLVCFRMENVQQFAFSPSGIDVDISGLLRLELINESTAQDTWTTWIGHRMSHFLDFIGSRFQCTTQSMMCLLKPLFPYGCEQWPASSNNLVRNFVFSGWMTHLRVLVLHNAGIRRLENVGWYCPQLEVLEVLEDVQHSMNVSINNAPNLKRLIVGGNQDSMFSMTSLCINWRELALQLGECLQLQELHVDGSFHEVRVEGLLPSNLRDLRLANDRFLQFVPSKLIRSCTHQLSLLEKLQLSCKKVESLDFTRRYAKGGLPCLKEMVLHNCDSLTHLSIGPSYLPNLVKLSVYYCEELQVVEGDEQILLLEKLKVLELLGLPQLQMEPSTVRSLQLEVFNVSWCPKIDFSVVLQASKGIRWMELNGVGIVGQHRDGGVLITNIDDESKAVQDQQLTLTSSSAVPRAVLDQELTFTSSSPVLDGLDHRLTFLEGKFVLLRYLILSQVDHLQEIESIQHLPNLLVLSLAFLPHLARVSGTWPASIQSLEFRDCPMLSEIPPINPTTTYLSCDGCEKLIYTSIDFPPSSTKTD